MRILDGVNKYYGKEAARDSELMTLLRASVKEWAKITGFGRIMPDPEHNFKIK
jgi:hypothetical protein